MDIKHDKKVIVTGRTICLATGIISTICGVYWMVKALAFDDTHLPEMLSTIACGLFLVLYGKKK